MRPRRLRFGGLALLVGLAFAALMSFTGCESPASRALSVLRNPLSDPAQRLDAITQVQGGGKEALLEAKPELIEALASTLPDCQRAAESALILIGPEAACDLVKVSTLDKAEGKSYVTTGQFLSHGSVLRILRQTSADDSVVEQVEASIKDGDYAARLHATELLGALSVKNGLALTNLIKLIGDQNPMIRIAAINEAADLSKSSESSLISALTAALDDPTIAVREAACISLGNMGPSAIQAQTTLKRLANGHDPHVVQLARIALSNISKPKLDR